jgi:hypothetical protein
MSSFRTIKKKGRLIKKYVRKVDTWRDEIRKAARRHVVFREPQIVCPEALESLPDADYAFYSLIDAVRAIGGFVTFTTPYNGRGLHMLIYPREYRTYDAILSTALEISGRSTYDGGRWKSWYLAISATTLPASTTPPTAPSEASRRFIDIRIYPPSDSVTGSICKEMWENPPQTGRHTMSQFLEYLRKAAEQYLAKKRSERRGEVPAPPDTSLQCK